MAETELDTLPLYMDDAEIDAALLREDAAE